MPTMVKVAASDATDGEERVISEKAGDQEAQELAYALHANTGEVVTLVPWEEQEDGEYELNEKAARTVGASAEETKAAENEQLDDLSVKELKALAEEKGVDVPAKAKKADLIAALEA